MAEWDTFILNDFKDLVEDEPEVRIIRELAPGKRKYRSTYARTQGVQRPQEEFTRRSG